MPISSKLLVTCLLVSLVVFIPASVLTGDYQPTNCPNLDPLPAKEAIEETNQSPPGTNDNEAIPILKQPTKETVVLQTQEETPPLAAQTQEKTHDFADAYAAEVIRLINIERTNAGLGQLTADTRLNQAAAIRAIEIQSNFSHTRPDGRTCFSALSEVNASYNTTGENIAIGQASPQIVVQAWMASPGHQENIMSPAYGKIGVAALANNTFNYGGYAWTQFFTN